MADSGLVTGTSKIEFIRFYQMHAGDQCKNIAPLSKGIRDDAGRFRRITAHFSIHVVSESAKPFLMQFNVCLGSSFSERVPWCGMPTLAF